MTQEATGTDLQRQDTEHDPHGPYALARLEVAGICEGLCGQKLEALEILARLEQGLWAAALLHQPDASKAREAFGVGLTAFTQQLR